MQLNLDGYQVPYQCKKCSKCFATMKESSKHHALKHKTRSKTKITISFALENFNLTSTRKIEVIEI